MNRKKSSPIFCVNVVRPQEQAADLCPLRPQDLVAGAGTRAFGISKQAMSKHFAILFGPMEKPFAGHAPPFVRYY